MTAPFTLPIPTYQCHKRVQALRIKAMVPNPRGYELHFEDERFVPVQVREGWVINNAAASGDYAIWDGDGVFYCLPAAAFEAGYTLVETADGAVRQDASPATLSVNVAKMVESNGRVTWMVLLAKSPDASPLDCHQVYSDAIEGRARYEAAVLAHFLGLGPTPDILAFDTDPPAEEVRRVSPAPDWSAWPGGPSEVEAELASRDAEIERLTAEVGVRQAEIDRIMLEFCPEEMTPEQKAEWARHQKPVGPATQAAQEVGK